ncbi:hypothetical protein [Phytomonospora endophytica]|uniref:Uncharacterized protein n=1 Tax=Phytomonospora endophytica TaxID=714109 RepID=A0A841G077_9ACTN|nr:hypothetical protein [Phytomonospora endophytica]MBB6039057.1 hypothetical protein [Phytomonospora endophytica]GIG71486.1 hypothetical protein Pen01_77810 [Phytomonospora endophytica]
MHPPQYALAPVRRSSSVVIGTRAAVTAAIGHLLAMIAAVGMAVSPGPDTPPAMAEGGGFIAVGFFTVLAAPAGCVLTHAAVVMGRRRNAGRIMFNIAGAATLFVLGACTISSAGSVVMVIVRHGPSAPNWAAFLGATGAVTGVAAAVTGLIFLNNREARTWFGVLVPFHHPYR